RLSSSFILIIISPLLYTSHTFSWCLAPTLYTRYSNFFSLMIRPPPRSTLFLYTTLFRSSQAVHKMRTPGHCEQRRGRSGRASHGDVPIPRRTSPGLFRAHVPATVSG